MSKEHCPGSLQSLKPNRMRPGTRNALDPTKALDHVASPAQLLGRHTSITSPKGALPGELPQFTQITGYGGTSSGKLPSRSVR